MYCNKLVILSLVGAVPNNCLADDNDQNNDHSYDNSNLETIIMANILFF